MLSTPDSGSTPKRSDRKLSEVSRHLITPSGIVETEWPTVAKQLEKMDWPFDKWQENLCTVGTGLRADGIYACGVGGLVLSIPRQVGKTYTIGGLVFALCMAKPGTLAIWTAHRARTHNETFRDMAAKAKSPSVKPFIANVRKSNGEQEIEFTNGSRVLFGARENGFGRGFKQVDILVLDEAQILTLKAMEDMVPATNAAPNGLVLMMGTPPRPNDPGEVFTDRREAALSGEDEDVLYVEMSADEDANPNDREQWATANPSYPHRTSETAILRMRKLLGSVQSFMREGLGIWDKQSKGRKAFLSATWDSRAAEPVTDGIMSFGVKFSADGAEVGLSGAIKAEDGRIHIEGIRQAPMTDGTQWLVGFLVERKDRAAQIVIDGKSGVGYLVNALRAERVGAKVVIVPTLDQVITAHSMLDRAVTQAEVTHSGDPDFDAQAKSAVRRKVGNNGGFGWEAPTEDGSVILLDSATLAFWAAKTSKRRPGRKQSFL
jgi:hypothetical protein